MNHGKIHSVLRSKVLPASIVLILTLGSAMYCRNTLPLDSDALTELENSSLSLQPTRPLDSPPMTIQKGNHYTLERQQRWIF
ncbi:hypothetical protein [Azotobacter armeniacus]